MDHSLPPAAGSAPALEQRRTASRRGRRAAAATLFLWDQALIFIGFAIAYWVRYVADMPPALDLIVTEVAVENQVDFAAFVPITLMLMVVLGALFTARGLYRRSPRLSLFDQIGIVGNSILTGIALLIVVVFLYRPLFYSRLIFALAGGTIFVLIVLARLVTAGVLHWLWSRGIGRERVLVVGGTGLGRQVLNALAAQPGLGYIVAGYLDERPIIDPERQTRVYRHLGPIDDLERVIDSQQIDQVILALPFWLQGQLPELVERCRALGVEYHIAPDLYQISFDRVDVTQVSGVPLIQPKDISLKGLNLVVKRAFDVAAVLLSAPVTVPLMLAIALLVRLDSAGPILFRQQRVGKGGSPFTCLKFRTMVPDAESRKAELSAFNEADGPLFKIRDDPRVTRIGRFLRRSSLDELPQLINVLRGEMSLIGPRPALPEEVERYEPWHRRRLEVSPGLAGLGQALGRSDISFDELVRLDIYYAENWSVGMDIRILLMVIPAVISGRGAY